MDSTTNRQLRDLSRGAAALREALGICTHEQKPTIVQALDEIEAAAECAKGQSSEARTLGDLCVVALALVRHAANQSSGASVERLFAEATRHLRAAKRQDPKGARR
jgi:hypothetical protein